MPTNNLLIASITIPNYRRDFKLSDEARPTFYEKGKKKIPYQFCDKALYRTQGIRDPNNTTHIWREYPVIRQRVKKMVDFLVDVSTNERVIANAKKVGKARFKTINGQDLYSGNISKHARNKMMGAIKDQFRNYTMVLGSIAIEKLPIRIEVLVYDTVKDVLFKNGRWDLGNRMFPYNKAFEDLLTENKVIPDDEVSYLTGPPNSLFCPVDTSEQRKLVYNIYSDRREEIVNNPYYKEMFKL